MPKINEIHGRKIYVLRDVQPNNTAPQALTANGWRTIRFSDLSGAADASLSSNEITLPSGKYLVNGMISIAGTPAINGLQPAKARLYSVTGASEIAILGEKLIRQYTSSPPGIYTVGDIQFCHYLTLTTTTTLRFEVYSSYNFDVGTEDQYDIASEDHVFTSVSFDKIA